MATETLKVLGQVAPAASALTTLYTTPAVTQTTVSSLVVCNTSQQPQTFRTSVAVAGAADATAQYVYYDVPITANSTFVATVGLTLGAADVVRVQSSGSVAFGLFGVELA